MKIIVILDRMWKSLSTPFYIPEISATKRKTFLITDKFTVSLYHPCWHRAEARILTFYRAFSGEKIEAKIMVRVGLQYLNISLKGKNVF